jgi:hypothetical protein
MESEPDLTRKNRLWFAGLTLVFCAGLVLWTTLCGVPSQFAARLGASLGLRHHRRDPRRVRLWRGGAIAGRAEKVRASCCPRR